MALDLPGFGLSEKPISRELYTMDFLVNVVGGFINQLEISNSVLFAHDWGGVLGLQLASTYEPPFSGLILCNSLLPVEGMKIPFLFRLWRCFARYSPVLPVAMVVNLACDKRLSRVQKHGYNYPFKSGEDKKAIRLMPQLLPFKSGQSGFSEIKKAWAGLAGFEKPVLTLFSDRDPITRGGEKLILDRIPGAQNQNHRILHGGHFIQEDAPHEIANHIISCAENSLKRLMPIFDYSPKDKIITCPFCGSTYHYLCVAFWLSKYNSCPLCQNHFLEPYSEIFENQTEHEY